MNSGDRYNNDTFTENYDRQDSSCLHSNMSYFVCVPPSGASDVPASRMTLDCVRVAVVVSAVWFTTPASGCRSLQALRACKAATSCVTTPRAPLLAPTSSRCGAHALTSL